MSDHVNPPARSSQHQSGMHMHEQYAASTIPRQGSHALKKPYAIYIVSYFSGTPSQKKSAYSNQPKFDKDICKIVCRPSIIMTTIFGTCQQKQKNKVTLKRTATSSASIWIWKSRGREMCCMCTGCLSGNMPFVSLTWQQSHAQTDFNNSIPTRAFQIDAMWCVLEFISH